MVNFTGSLMHNGVNKNARRYNINVKEAYESILSNVIDNIIESDSQFAKTISDRYASLSKSDFHNALSETAVSISYDEVLDFLYNDYLLALNVIDHLYDALLDIKAVVDSYRTKAAYRLSKIQEREEDILNNKENIILSNEVSLYCSLTDNVYDDTHYLESAVDQIRSYIASLLENIPSEPSEEYEIFAKKMIEDPLDHEEYMRSLFVLFRQDTHMSVVSPEMLKELYNKSSWSISILDLLSVDIAQALDRINSTKFKITNIIDKYKTYSRLSVSIDRFNIFRKDMYISISFLYERVKIMTEFFTARADACIEYVDTYQSIFIDAINQIDLDTCTIYDAPSDIEDEYDDILDYYTTESEAINTLLVADTLSINESVGLILMQESLKDSITKYMNKIVTQVTNVTTKINNVISTKVKEKLADHLGKIESPEKPDPNFNILNYTRYNLDKMDRITPTAFNYLAQKEDLKSKDSYMKKYYPDLYDTEKSVYQKMLELVTIGTDDKVVCTPELIDNCKDYCTRGYKEYLANNQAFAKAIEDAKASAESLGTASGMAATQSDESQAVNDAAIMTEADAPNPTKPATQRVTTQPGVTKVNRDNNSKDKNTGFEDHDNVDKREGDTELMKALTMYCGITTKILSARIKVVNLVFKDRLKILLHYVTKNGWNKKKKETE